MILIDIEHLNLFIKTSYNDYKKIQWIIKIPDEPCVKVITGDHKQIICSKLHQFFKSDGLLVYAKDCLGETIISETGLSKIIDVDFSIGNLDCYDIQVQGKTYFSNGLLSHNSTISFIFILHYILFNANKTVAVLANKAATAKGILHKIKIAYQNLPKFLQQGITEWNKNSIELENGSRVLASSSSASNIRGESINILYMDECLSGNTLVTVKDKTTGEIKQITLKELYQY